MTLIKLLLYSACSFSLFLLRIVVLWFVASHLLLLVRRRCRFSGRYREYRRRGRRRRSAPGLPIEDDEAYRHGQPNAHVDPADLGLDAPFDGVRHDDHEHAAS